MHGARDLYFCRISVSQMVEAVSRMIDHIHIREERGTIFNSEILHPRWRIHIKQNMRLEKRDELCVFLWYHRKTTARFTSTNRGFHVATHAKKYPEIEERS